MPNTGTLHRSFSFLFVQLFPTPRVGATKSRGEAMTEVVHASSASRIGLVSMTNYCLGGLVLLQVRAGQSE
jgi:hypothetical protein